MNDKRFATSLAALVAAAAVAAAAAMVMMELESSRQRRDDAVTGPHPGDPRPSDSAQSRRAADEAALPASTLALAGRPAPPAH